MKQGNHNWDLSEHLRVGLYFCSVFIFKLKKNLINDKNKSQL